MLIVYVEGNYPVPTDTLDWREFVALTDLLPAHALHLPGDRKASPHKRKKRHSIDQYFLLNGRYKRTNILFQESKSSFILSSSSIF